MDYLYGEFSEEQISSHVKQMHNDIHKLLLYKDPAVTEKKFRSAQEFDVYFVNLLFRFGGLNELLGEPSEMVDLMETLQAALDESRKPESDYDFIVFRRLIFDAHGYLTRRFGEVR